MAGDQSIASAAISPDGRHIAFSATGLQGSLWLQPLDRHDPIQIEGVLGARDVFWSPDGNFIGFATSRGVGKVALRGLAVTMLVEESGFAPIRAAWSADGQWIAYVSAGGVPMRVSALGGSPRALLPSERRRRTMITSPSFVSMPDGRQLYIYGERSGEGSTVMARRIAGEQIGEPVRLVDGHSPTYSPTGHLLYQPEAMSAALWAIEFSTDTLETRGEAFIVTQNGFDPSVSSDGTLVYTDNSALARKRLVWVDRQGATVGEIGKEQQWVVGPILSPTGDRVLAAGGAGRDFDIWVHESDRPVLNRVTFDSAEKTGAIWAPDGLSIAFMQRGSPDLKLVTVGDGTPARTIYEMAGPGASPLDWSSDARYILYQQRRIFRAGEQAGGEDAVRKVAPGAGSSGRSESSSISYLERVGDSWESREFLPSAPYVADDAVFSPDGRYVAYESNESGDFELYVRPFPEGSQRWQVTTEGGRLARWSEDGKELYFLRDDTLYSVATDTRSDFVFGEPAPLFSRESLLGMRRYPTYDAGACRSFRLGRSGRRSARTSDSGRAELVRGVPRSVAQPSGSG